MVGQSIIETAVGILVMVPVALLLLDLGAMVAANMVNDSMVKTAARAAANRKNSVEAGAAVAYVQEGFKPSTLICDLKLKLFKYDTDRVVVESEMQMHLPVPVFGLPGTLSFRASATEANVSIQDG